MAILQSGVQALPAPEADNSIVPIEVCGTLKAFTPATQTAGSITVGPRSYSLAPGTTLGNGGVVVAIGRDLCLTAGLDTTTHELVSYLAFGIPASSELCGNLFDGGAGTGSVRLSADFGDMDLLIAPGADPGPLTAGARACFLIGIDRAGDASVRERSAVDAPNDRQRVSVCGRVNQYLTATPSSAGRMAIGSRVYAIEPGTGYTGDPAGDRTDRTVVGSAMCLSGTIGDAGGLRDYATRLMDGTTGGNTFAYTPATATAPGLLVISPISRFSVKVPAGSSFGVDLSRGSHCYAIAVDAGGDAEIERVIDCDRGHAAAGPSVRGLPSTSVSPRKS